MRKRNTKAALIAAVLSAALAAGACSAPVKENGGLQNSGQGSETTIGGVEKPEKITIMVDGTFQATKANGQDEWVERWEELTGIELEVIQPDHDAYYDVLGQTFASGPENWPDVVLLGNTHYAGYAAAGALWDMTEAWKNSSMAQDPEVKKGVVEGNMLDGHLYGLPLESGGGCITYIRQAWLDNCGLEVPATYEEYLQVLDAFTNGDPDGDGVNGNTVGVSAAGFVAKEAPYTNYLPEFYQDAYPSFYQKDNGEWVDGFTQDAMKEAIQRLQEAYQKGYIDKESLTNATSNCRTKFGEGQFGVFTYWANSWADDLHAALENNNLDGELVAIPPIAELGQYWERIPASYAITSSCKNPEGVFKYFLESIFDNGDMQKLWIYGVEDVHWSTKAETVLGNTYEEGQFHMLEKMDQPGVQGSTINTSQVDSILPMKDDPGANTVGPETKEASKAFYSACKMAPQLAATDAMSQYNGDLITLKNSIIADCIVQGLSVEEGYARFEKDGGAEWSEAIVDSLNQ